MLNYYKMRMNIVLAAVLLPIMLLLVTCGPKTAPSATPIARIFGPRVR